MTWTERMFEAVLERLRKQGHSRRWLRVLAWLNFRRVGQKSVNQRGGSRDAQRQAPGA
jgi:hypothetical protein